MLVDLSQLNIEQMWAIQWGRQEANKAIPYQIEWTNMENERITKENEKLLPEQQKQLLSVPVLYTDQSWADEQVWNWVNQQLSAFQYRVKQNVENKINSMTIEERLQLMANLQVEPVLKSE